MTPEEALKIIKEQIIYSNLKIRKGLNNDKWIIIYTKSIK